jgi:hypothetical protein
MNVSIYVDVEEVYSELSTREKKIIAEWLYDDGIINIKAAFGSNNTTVLEDEFIEKISKIASSYISLTKEQTEIIENIYNQL